MGYTSLLAAAFLTSTLAVPCTAGQTDISFLVAGKTANYRQWPNGGIEVLNYHFFAEIFLQEDGKVQGATLLTPLAEQTVAFTDGGYALELHGGRYRTEAELETSYPDGHYTFSYTTPGMGSVSQQLQLGNPVAGGSGLPRAPQIILSQHGKPVQPDRVDPVLDLRVSWSPFIAGMADPKAIMDDLIFVIMGDCEGVRRAHSGRPFENTSYLTYQDSYFVIRATLLQAENVYQVSVEHAVLETGNEHNVIAFTTFASTTFLDIHTTGTAPAGKACHNIRKTFDAGQEIL